MKTLILKIVSELTFHQVVASLTGKSIPHTIRKQGDSSFPMFGQENYFGRIELASEHAQFIQELRKGNEDQIIVEEVLQEETGNKKVSFGRILLISYAVIVTFLLFRYWNAYTHAYDDKNFDYVWSSSNTQFFCVSKKTGKVFTISSDVNFDLNFEKFQILDPDENLIYESFDTNEDGWYETFYRYQPNQTLTEQGFDRDRDGSFEYFEMILETGDTLVFEDKNMNGAYEIFRQKRGR